MRLYSLPVVNRGAKSQEGGWIALAWIVVDLKLYLGISMHQGWCRVPEGTVVAADDDFVDICAICCKFSTERGQNITTTKIQKKRKM